MDKITIEDFHKIEIRVCTVVRAEKLPDSDKLLRLIFDVGGGEERQVLSGIAATYPDPEVLVGKQIPVVLNLEPRKMRGEISNGMILAVGEDASNVVLLCPIREVASGSQVH